MGAPAGDENGKNGYSHLREDVGGDPEPRELLLAVGELLLASTTASPFLTFGFISLSLTSSFLTDTNQSFPVESKAPQTMGPWLRRGEGTAQAQPPLAAAGKVGRQMVKIGRQVEFGS